MDDKHEVIVDVGGNKTFFFSSWWIKKVGSFGNVKWIIPLGDGELDGKMQLQLWKIKKLKNPEENLIFALK